MMNKRHTDELKRLKKIHYDNGTRIKDIKTQVFMNLYVKEVNVIYKSYEQLKKKRELTCILGFMTI